MKKRSFFERLTGNIRLSDEEENDIVAEKKQPAMSSIISKLPAKETKVANIKVVEEKEEVKEEEEGELSVDVYQTPSDIFVQTMVAGVDPANLSITITRDSVTIKGRREDSKGIDKSDYFVKELYWGSFGRSIQLPEEVEPDVSEATEKHGLLIIRLPKINKYKQTNLKIKSL